MLKIKSGIEGERIQVKLIFAGLGVLYHTEYSAFTSLVCYMYPIVLVDFKIVKQTNVEWAARETEKKCKWKNFVCQAIIRVTL